VSQNQASDFLTMKVLCIVVVLFLQRTHGLSQNQPIKRVAVIGSAISGLAISHSLVTDPAIEQVCLFESRPALDYTAGAGVQLNSGLAILGKINPKLQEAVLAAGLRMERVQSRSKPWNKDKNPFDKLLEVDFKQVIERAGGAVKDSLIQKDGQVLWISIMRGALQKALFDTLPSEKTSIDFGKQLTGLQGVPTGGVMCQFADGSEHGPFDLVIGCDGIKSAVKEFVDKEKISSDPTKREGVAAGIYSGLRIRFAVCDGKAEDEQAETGSLTQYFGDGAYCLSSVAGAGPNQPNTKFALTVFLDEDYIGPFRRKRKKEKESMVQENADWTQDVKKELETARATMLQQLKDCNIPDMDLAPTVAAADRFFELGVYTHNPFCSWSKEIPGSGGTYAVLCGDAAHAMPPFLGQGANQAIQDAYCLGTRIKRYNEKRLDDDVKLGELLKEYETIRWPSTTKIFFKAGFLGYLETGGSGGLYSKFRDVFFKTMGIVGVAERELLDAATPNVEKRI
jgi:salicylate hydroxylase